MADTVQFFTEYLPKKITDNPSLATQVNAVFQFDIADAGTWTLDLASSPGSVREGPAENPGCTIVVSKADWEALLDKPGSAMTLFMTGKLKIKGSMAQGMALQKILA